ncbi:Phenylalanyl-tRNA synthetase [Penicillium atrosanguineum]|uniref:Choline kinase N-terminal domain-containing protein n=1 Tax=Penicillium atrosanguineum TaxID=1132637 RepID=A0A9W9QIW6_9EURO|nr:Phenylalanyl-tRNA synthetase [Penicillium atrosanguineum]KAJ5314576.1 Phenylalanyl-tRNA synthetase [Penicillium atrosanguineum]KAJ5331747.1 hypothetical protein N7476_001530 [Penicillium atrosanguineum]
MPSALSNQSSVKADSSAIDETEQSTKPAEDPQLGLFHQVFDWLQHEKTRRQARKARRAEAVSATAEGTSSSAPVEDEQSEDPHPCSESTFSLDKLEKILLQFAGPGNVDALGALHSLKRASRRRPKGLRRGSASESDYTDVEAPVPGVEAYLDNSKTLAYMTNDVADEEITASTASLKRSKDREAWTTFRTEIVRLAHTLQLRGWRKVPMESADEIEVIRLSGALTNAVYVVRPPKNLPALKTENRGGPPVSRKPPPKLLLRIYGPQVDHLIDREKELQILRRLGRKNIGPRVLGTFLNGRFEEYFDARPLTPKELRLPETAKQIAKRMRELHDGIELLEEEREGGPMIFKNWDKWVDRCEQVTTWLDKELESPQNEIKAATEPWRRRGFVCGVPWAMFRKAVENYRLWLIASCGGMDEIKRLLVFAHNDTQYGNLLRMEPASESPLLLPANEHKQLVVIDFEYSSANTPGVEFANHFTEWCYNYHDEERSWACNNRLYPTPEEQRRSVLTYLTHRPGVAGGGSASPAIHGRHATAITPLSLDDTPDGFSSQQVQSNEEELEAKVHDLMHQIRLWRVMNSAQWVAWGIVQAKAPGMEEGLADVTAANNRDSKNGHDEDGNGENKEHLVDADVDEEDFDYLAYAQDRALFFWSDLLAMNLVNPDELPRPMVEHLRARALDY